MKISPIFILLMAFMPFLAISQSRDLNYYLQNGKQNSPLLLDFQNQIRSLSLDSEKLKASNGPIVDATGGAMYAPTYHNWGYDAAITNGQNISALVTVHKDITSKSLKEARFNSILLDQSSLKGQTKLTLSQLSQDITAQYISCYSDQLQWDLSQEIYTFLLGEDEALKQLTRSSVFKQTDYLTFKIALQQQSISHDQLKVQLDNDLATLNYLCGIQDSTFYRVEDPLIQVDSISSFEQSSYGYQYRLDSLKNDNAAKLISLNYQPKISVFADGGYQSALPAQAYKNLGLSVGMNINLPIYDGKQKKSSLLQNQLLQESREKYQSFAKSRYGQQITQIQQQIREVQSLIANSSEQVKYARTLVEANKKQLMTGDIRMTDYLLSINNYMNLRVSLIQYGISIQMLNNQLKYLILK